MRAVRENIKSRSAVKPEQSRSVSFLLYGIVRLQKKGNTVARGQGRDIFRNLYL